MARSMTKQMEALRLIHTTTLSDRQIASALYLSKTTISRYRKIAVAGFVPHESFAPLSL